VLDTSKWATKSSAESDCQQGNPGNQQLEWNQAANMSEANGELDITAIRKNVTSPCTGHVYNWTSGLITTTPSYSFQYGYIEERAILPGPAGFWPAFWTWQIPGGTSWVETDAYEFYSDNHSALYLTQHSGAGGGCKLSLSFDPTNSWHVYGVDIEPTGTDWYIDGAHVCHAAGTAQGLTNIIDNNAVYSGVPPASTTTTAVKRVDYVRAWQH
jgi:beta-glucanase (GH16 family)